MDVQICKGITLPVDISKLVPQDDITDLATVLENGGGKYAALKHIVYIGLRNILMDSHAGISTDEPDYQAKALAVVEKKLAALMAGEVRVASTREGDPVKAEAIRIASDRIKAALKKAGRKVSDVDPKALRAKAVELVSKDEAIMVIAAQRVAEAKAVAAPDELTEGL